MEQPVESHYNPRKRSARDLDSFPSIDASWKRSCTESSSTSPHLSLLEDLYDLEADDEGPATDAPSESSTQEDLVAEIMKSLEKVIEETEECRGVGDVPTRNLSAVLSLEVTTALDFAWGNEELEELPSSQNASFHGVLGREEGLNENAEIRELLQASDDELGLPMSSSSSDLEESSFHEEWASLANESGPANFSWLDASFHQYEEAPALAKEVFEPLLLF